MFGQRILCAWKQRLLVILLLVIEPCVEELASVSYDSSSSPSHSTVVDAQRLCSDRLGFLDPKNFSHRSCSFCYKYLFPTGKPLALHPLLMGHLYFVANASSVVVPDPSDSTSTDIVCSTLNVDECKRWKDCCTAAVDCCTSQRLTTPLSGGDDGDRSSGYCGRVWDGFSCWGDTEAGTTAYMPCPSHLDHSVTTKNAVKTCTSNGTWLERRGYQWTDYRPCVDKQAYLIGVYMSFACNVLGILLLIPAIVIFCTYRDLLKQHRIRIHVNFFASLVLCSGVTIAWYYLVHLDLLVNSVSTETVLYRNPVWCSILSFVKIYSTSATYCWMFNEGFYLHRLITHTFELPENIKGLYLFGWLFPAVAAIVYGVIRGTKNNASCWVKSFDHFEWIIYAPNFLCMVLNFVFLCNILRILMFCLHSHPHEPNNFRRGVKAAFMLIPLFGIQFFLTVYRPPIGMQTEMIHECLFLFTTNSQGIFVSLIFCFFSSEVMSRLPFSWSRRRWSCCAREEPSSPRSRGVSTQLTQFTLSDMRRSLSNVAFCSAAAAGTTTTSPPPPPQNGSLINTPVGGGGGGSFFGPEGGQKKKNKKKKQPTSQPNSCCSPDDVRGTNGVDRRPSLVSNATEVDHVEAKSPPDSPPKYSALFTNQRQSLVSPGKSKYSALATVDSV